MDEIHLTVSGSPEQKTAEFDKELQELRFELDKARSAQQLAEETSSKAKEGEGALRDKLTKAEKELDRFRLEARKATADLHEVRSDLEAQVKTLEKAGQVRDWADL